jgi:superfamily II DNA/RNA helicase
MVVSFETWLPVLHHILAANIAKGEKTMVFVQAAKQARLLAFMLNRAPQLGAVFQIHSRLSQNERISQLEGILF